MTMKTPDAKVGPWIFSDEVATRPGVAKDSAYRWIDTKRLPSQEIGRLWKIKASAVDDWVRAAGAIDNEKGYPSDR